MRRLFRLVLRYVTRALRLAVGCVASLCRQVALRSSGVPQPVVRWRIADVTSLFRLRLSFLQPALVEPRRSMPAPCVISVTSVLSTARSAARSAFGLGLAVCVHTATSRSPSPSCWPVVEIGDGRPQQDHARPLSALGYRLRTSVQPRSGPAQP